MKTYTVSITTPTGEAFTQEEVEYLKAPALNGTMGVMANHAPTVAALLKGPLTMKHANGEDVYHIEEGVIEVLPDHNVVVLSAHVEKFK